jgi:uncharacterized protein (UPF0548 family)
MLVHTRLTDERVREILAPLADASFQHEPVGITRSQIAAPPPGYRLDVYGVTVGEGDTAFEAACARLRDFDHYPPSFTRVVKLSPGLAAGQVFGTLALHGGFASLHPCRVVEVIDETRPRRFGFSLGTLPGHVLVGEECFLIELDEDSGRVRYEVRAVSRPAGTIARLGLPIVRLFQARFRRESCAVMRSRCDPPAG